MLMTYIVQLKGILGGLLWEHLELFNGIHEGVLVLDKHEMRVKFANEPAAFVLKQLSETAIANEESLHLLSLDNSDIEKTIFQKSQYSLSNADELVRPSANQIQASSRDNQPNTAAQSAEANPALSLHDVIKESSSQPSQRVIYRTLQPRRVKS